METRQPRGRRADLIEIDIASDDMPAQNGVEEEEEEDDDDDGGGDSSGEVDDDDDDADEEEEIQDLSLSDLIFPPPGLKEISSLASWTVSTAKPGNGVAALRSADTGQFWQSDGPQPHVLSIHFFKLVAIAAMRIYLDFAADESYTPTKIQFLAGMGVHDLLEFAEMSFEQPAGWIDVDFSQVGPAPVEAEAEEDGAGEVDWGKRPVLRAFLVQVRILENHQNGKDTHLRAVQLFARDEAHPEARTRAAPARRARFSRPAENANAPRRALPRQSNNIKLAPWMMEPDLR